MLAFIAKRLLQLLPTLLGITLLAFVLLRLAPGDPLSMGVEPMAGAGASKASVTAWRELQGLDQPLPQQYARWLWHSVRLDFGRSLTDERPVHDLLFEALPTTVLLNGLALILIYALAIPLGVLAATRQGHPLERLLSGSAFVLYSIPSFWLALLLLVLFAGGQFFTWLPLRGLQSDGAATLGLGARGLDLAWHLLLPVCCLAYPALARTSRFQRAAMREVLQQDYVRTARAKGLTERAVIWRHAWRNALLPMVTLLSLDLPVLVGGSLVIERIFTIPGMGMLMFDAIARRDYPVVMGVVTLVAVTTQLAVLAGDLMLGLLDPRLRLPGAKP